LEECIDGKKKDNKEGTERSQRMTLVRNKSMTAPEGPPVALSKISKSHISFELWNQFNFSCPRASVVGTIRAAEATFPSMFADVRSIAALEKRWLDS
jgi:hypothetical protein